MNLILKKQLQRRAFVRGIRRTSLALPMLDAVAPALAAPTRAPARLAILYFPNGARLHEHLDTSNQG